MRRIRTILVFGVLVTACGAGLLVLNAGPYGTGHWASEIAASFRWQLAGAGLVGLLTLAALRAWRAALVVAALTAWLGWPAASLWLPRSGAAPEGLRVRVATVNAHAGNRDSAALTRWLREADPDIVAVQEVDLFWLEHLRSLSATWPHRATLPEREDEFHAHAFGMAILSKHPLQRIESFDHLGRSGGIVATVTVVDRNVHVIAAHPERPGRSERVARRNHVLQQIAERARDRRPVIVLGDLNTSSGSPAFTCLLRDAGLCDSRRGFGRQPTWRSWSPIRGLTVDIDHVLVSEEFWVVDRRAEGDTGSDHAPVLAELILAAPTPP